MWILKKYPEQHCLKKRRSFSEIGAEPEFIHAVCSHGYGIQAM